MGGPFGRWSSVVSVVLSLLLMAESPAALGGGPAGGDPSSTMDGRQVAQEPALGANERRLLPARDLAAVAIGTVPAGAPAWSVLADGIGLDPMDDSYAELSQSRGSRLRVGLSRAPSGVVERLVAGWRARTLGGSVGLVVRVFDGDRQLGSDVVRTIRPGDGWVTLGMALDGLEVGSAETLAVELTTRPAGGGGVVQVSGLRADVRLHVSLRFAPTPLVGGGRYTAVAQAGPSSALLVGTASGGVFRSAGSLGRFAARNAAFLEPDQLRIASIVSHPTRPGELLLAAGDHGRSGWIFRSTDDGRTWSLVVGRLSFSAAVEPSPDAPPSAMGTLLALADATDGSTTIWAATTGHGLMRSTDDGRTWRSLGLGGRVLRGLATDPAAPGTIYLATAGSGTWRVDGAWGDAPVFRSIQGGPRDPEELALVDGALVVAGGPDGLFRLDGDRLVSVDPGMAGRSVRWTTVDGAAVGDGSILIAAGEPTEPGNGPIPIVRSFDGGMTWAPATTPDRVDVASLGDGTWPLAPELTSMAPGGPAFRPLHLLVVTDGATTSETVTIHLGAEGALWGSPDSGRSWRPRIAGLSGLGARGARPIDDAAGGWVTSLPRVGMIVASRDLRSAAIAAWTASDLPSLADPVATDLAFDASDPDASRPAVVAVASTLRPPAGEVVIAPDGVLDGPWATAGFADAFPETRPTAVAVGRDVSGARVIVATIHPGGGVARRVGDGPWERADAGSIGQDPKTVARADLAWIPGTTTIYCFDPGTGVHRSIDAGASWQLIWEARSNRSPTARLATGTDPAVVFASTNQGLFRLDGADGGTVADGTVTLVRLGTFPKPGPITLDGDGRLWVVAEPLPGAPARLAVSWDPMSSEPAFHDLASESLVNTIVAPDAIGVDAKGQVLLADSEIGLIIGRPASSIREPWLPPDIVIHPLLTGEGQSVPIARLDPAVMPPLVDPVVLHIAMDGADTADGGTREHALATLDGAQRLLSSRFGADAGRLDRDVHLLVHAGRYPGQSVRWMFTRPDRVIRIEGVPDGADADKPRFIGCVETSCASTRAWLRVPVARGEPTNVQIANVQVALYHRAVVFEGGPDPITQWNGGNVIHRSAFHGIGTGYRREIMPDVWSAGVWILDASRDNRIVGNLVTDSYNRMDHANEWFHTVYASHGASGNVVERNVVLRTSGDFHVRDGADGNVFARNLMAGSFYLAIVTEWSAGDETDVCGTRIEANVVIGEWRGLRALIPWSRQTAAPDGRCAREGVSPYLEPGPNLVIALMGGLGAMDPR